MTWLCIDAGTSVIKAVLLDAAGKELAVSRQSIAVSRPEPGHAEQDMDAVWKAVVSVGRAVAAESTEEIEGIVTTAQGDGCWLVDAAANPVGPAILWNDGRAHEIVESWRARGVIEQAFGLSGSVAYPGLANAIWSWLKTHDPDRLARARWLLSCNGWLHTKLTAQIAADLSDASNPFCDVAARSYSPELLRLYGLEEQARLLPELSRSTPVGELHDEAAEAMGLRAGMPIVMAPYDIVAMALGCGCFSAGQGCVILGTTICPEEITLNAQRNGPPAGTTIALDREGLYLRAMPTLTGCEALDWGAAMLRAERLEDLSRMAARAPAGANGVVCLPYLSPAGERAPFLAPAARASFLQLSHTHSRDDMARALFEGLTFVIRECFAAASASPLKRIWVCGGGSRSELWRQLIADVCRCEVLHPHASELGARGALFVALTAVGAASSWQEAAQRCVVHEDVYAPEEKRSARYDDLFERFLKLRNALAETWRLPDKIR